MTVKREKSGQYSKGTRSPNPNGRPKKATVSESTSLTKEITEFATTLQTFIKNGQPVSQTPALVAYEKQFSEALAGKGSPERFIRLALEAQTAERKAHVEFLENAVNYKYDWTVWKKKQKPGTPWDYSIGPDPDLIIIKDGQVFNVEPLFADQEQRLVEAVFVQTLHDRRDKVEASLRWLRDRQATETDPYTLHTLVEDIDHTTYELECLRYRLHEHDNWPVLPGPWPPFEGEIPYDPEVDGPIDLASVNTDTGGSDDGSAEA